MSSISTRFNSILLVFFYSFFKLLVFTRFYSFLLVFARFYSFLLVFTRFYSFLKKCPWIFSCSPLLGGTKKRPCACGVCSALLFFYFPASCLRADEGLLQGQRGNAVESALLSDRDWACTVSFVLLLMSLPDNQLVIITMINEMLCILDRQNIPERLLASQELLFTMNVLGHSKCFIHKRWVLNVVRTTIVLRPMFLLGTFSANTDVLRSSSTLRKISGMELGHSECQNKG